MYITVKKSNPFNFLSLFNFRKARGYRMRNAVPQADLVDIKVVRQLLKDIGADKTREFLEYVEREFVQRTDEVLLAFKELDLAGLARAIHALKSCTLNVGALPLNRKLEGIEKLARGGDHSALSEVGELVELIRRTSEALRQVPLDTQA